MRAGAVGDLNGWWRFGLALARPVVPLLFRLRVRGADHVPTGAAIVAANHVSALDGPVLAIATGRAAHRMTRFLVAAEFFERRGFGWALRLYRQIPLRRGTGDAGALRSAIETVSAGALAGIFPEGRVNPDPEGSPQPGHRGVARIALATGAPIVPVGIWGTQSRWPRRGFRWRRPLRPIIAVVYGPPVPRRSPSGSADEVERLRDEVMAAIRKQVALARALTGSDV